MNIRLQTWFPYHIQICLNGREWLRRSLEREGMECLVHGNKFLHIADYQKAQQLLNEQLDTRFINLLREQLSETTFGSGRTDKQLSSKVSRHLRLLRVHGIIRKLPKQNRYQVTLKGVRLTNALNALLAASTENLLKMAA